MIEPREASKPGEVSSEAKVYTVEKGDTLVKIAYKTGIPLQKLLEMNPHLRGRENYIEVGEGINLDPETIPDWANREATAEEKQQSRLIGQTNRVREERTAFGGSAGRVDERLWYGSGGNAPTEVRLRAKREYLKQQLQNVEREWNGWRAADRLGELDRRTELQRWKALKRELAMTEGKLAQVYYQQLNAYSKEGRDYVAYVGGIKVVMPGSQFAPELCRTYQERGADIRTWYGHVNAPYADEPVYRGRTPINHATNKVDSRTLLVMVDNLRSVGVDEVEVSSLWRNSVNSPHKQGMAIDITAATRNGVTVRFNNDTVGTQSEEAMRIRDDIYNAFVNDERVSQALDPWKIYRYKGSSVRDNEWKSVLKEHSVTVEDYLYYKNNFGSTYLNNVLNISYLQQLMVDHRHHLHFTISY